MGKLLEEYRFFAKQPANMRILLNTNMVYALALPMIELFVGAYIIRNSKDFSLVMVYQLAQGTGIPITFMINGYLLKYIRVNYLYGAGMILSGLSMWLLMKLPELDLLAIALTGLMMGLAYGFFWANRVFLALLNTNDANRNYYYGLESFFFTFASIIMPIVAGYFLAVSDKMNFFNGKLTYAYEALALFVLLITLLAAIIVYKGKFTNPAYANFIFFKFHQLWRKMLLLSSLKGVAQGFVIAAPVMLIMRLVGNEGDLGSIQSIGALLSAALLYMLGRSAGPKHRVKIFSAGLLLFLLGAVVNLIFFSAWSAIFFVGCLVFSRPLLDLAYFPVQLGVIECVSGKEKRNNFAYLFSHELGLFTGRVFGCLLFIIVARNISEDAALRYALFAVAAVQTLSIFVLRRILNDCEWCEATKRIPIDPHLLKEPVELG